MQLEFFKLNWHLFVALAVIILLLALDPIRKRSGGIRSINAVELPNLMSHHNAVVVDISDPADYQNGHIPNAKNIPLSRLNDDIARINKFKSRPIVVACRVGTRSSKAANILKKHQFSDIRILHGGFASWTKENLPVEK